MPARRPIACCVEAPESFRPKASYALTVLLEPLGLTPAWTPREALGGGVYYGPRPDRQPDGVLALRLDPATAAFFDAGGPYDPAAVAEVEWDGEAWPVLFPGERGGDLVASAFFWLSGWQEVTTTARDVHGRFPYAASLQAALGCVGQPLVDVYRSVLAEGLAQRGVPVRRAAHWNGKPWAVALTHDLDLLRKRRLGTLARAVTRRDGRRGEAVRQALTSPNPRLHSLDRIAEAERSRGVGATYFFKTPAARSRWDVPYDFGPELRRRIAGLEADGFEAGLHPGYFAHDHAALMREERDRLGAVTGAPLVSVRQHFLRYDPVVTPRLQQAAGFRLDSTLGFAGREGFRRGTCFPFRLFDPAANAPLDLWELPLAAMDTTLFTHRRLAPAEAERAILDLFAATRRVGGCCVLLWHNTLYDEVDYPGQAAVFERTLDVALADGAAGLSLRDALTTYIE